MLHSVFHCTTGELQSPRNLHTWYRVFLFRSHSDGIFRTRHPKILGHSKTYFASCRVKQSQHDPDRGFEFNITKDTVYPYYLMEDTDHDNRHPYFDNWFDHERLRKKRQKWGKISDPFKQDRGVSGVRPDLYQINESKILMKRCAGYEIRFADTRDKI